MPFPYQNSIMRVPVADMVGTLELAGGLGAFNNPEAPPHGSAHVQYTPLHWLTVGLQGAGFGRDMDGTVRGIDWQYYRQRGYSGGVNAGYRLRKGPAILILQGGLDYERIHHIIREESVWHYDSSGLSEYGPVRHEADGRYAKPWLQLGLRLTTRRPGRPFWMDATLALRHSRYGRIGSRVYNDFGFASMPIFPTPVARWQATELSLGLEFFYRALSATARWQLSDGNAPGNTEAGRWFRARPLTFNVGVGLALPVRR